MTEEKKNEILNLTAEIMREYWHGNPEKFLSYLSPEVLWIGSMDSEYIHGAKNVKKRIKENASEMVDVCLKNEEYEVNFSNQNACLVVGRYTAYTKPETGVILSEKQRVTFLWTQNNKGIKISHLHLSNILHIQKDEEKFPTIAGRTTYEYVKMILQRQKGYSKIAVRDINGTTMFIPDFDIIYINSNGNYIEIHCQDKDVKCHDTLKNISKFLSDYFIPIGRKYIINTDNVIEINKNTIRLLNDYEIKIPAKSIKETTEKIKNNIVL